MGDKCEFRKTNGERCKADAQTSKNVCVFHDPAKAADGRRARRAGGLSRSQRAAVLPPDTPEHPLENAKDVSMLLGDSINRLRRGQLDPRVANAMGYLATVLLRALEQGPMEERMARLETTLGLVQNSQTSISTPENQLHGSKLTKTN
jgi:hypothetical protein